MNWNGVAAIYRFEMARAQRTLWQSLVAPVITTALYFVVFGSTLGGRGLDHLLKHLRFHSAQAAHERIHHDRIVAITQQHRDRGRNPRIPRQLEAPIPQARDPRAWDVLLTFGKARVGVAAETRLRDWQALLRREQMKAR